MLVFSGFFIKGEAQKTVQFLKGEFNSNGEFDQWTEWVTGKYKDGTKVEYRAMLSAAKKGCKITVETKNISNGKIQLLVVFGYSMPNVSTQMTGFEKVSIKSGESESTTYVSGYCGGKGNDYKACYACAHEYKLYLQ